MEFFKDLDLEVFFFVHMKVFHKRNALYPRPPSVGYSKSEESITHLDLYSSKPIKKGIAHYF